VFRRSERRREAHAFGHNIDVESDRLNVMVDRDFKITEISVG
jgi:hypothetical protein